MKESMQSFVLGFSGRIASGKSTVSKIVATTLQYPRVSFGDYVRHLARHMGLNDSDRQILQAIGNFLAEHPREFCAKVLAQADYTPGHHLVIDGIRHKHIVDELRVQIAPVDLILIYVEAEQACIEDRLRLHGYTDLDIIQRLEHDPTEAEVLTVLPDLADLRVKTDNIRPVESVAEEILQWVQKYTAKERVSNSEEKLVVSRFEYERLKEEAQQLRYVVLDTWLSEAETKAKLQRCADFAVEALHNDKTLRVPRSLGQRENGFTSWRNEWRDRLGTAIEDEISKQFSGIAHSLPSDTIKDIVVDYVWPQIEDELLAFALEGLARTWVRRHMGDATLIGRPRLETDHWVVPLGIRGRGEALGQVVLDRDGNILEAASSSRNDILAQIHD